MSSSPNEKFRRRAAKTDISNLFDDLPELDDDEKSENQLRPNTAKSSEPKKVVQVNTSGSELFDDLPPLTIEDGKIKDLKSESTQLSAFAKDGQGDIKISSNITQSSSVDPTEVDKKKKLADIMARRKTRKREKRDDDGLFGEMDDLDIDD